MSRVIYVITGVMASGKSTVGELLSKRLKRGVHLRGDIFRRMITSGRAEMTENATPEALEQLDMRYELAAMTARKYFDHGFDVVVQDNYYCERLEYFTALFEDYPIKVVVLCPNVETVKKREEGRLNKGYVGFDIHNLYQEFMDTTPRIGLWIDNSELTPEQTVERILSHSDI